MSRYYQNLDRELIDYELFEIPGVPHSLRGPPIDFDRPFVACIGAAQTFGRFVSRPFPRLLAERTGMQVLNFAIGGCGPEMYRRPENLEILRRAKLVVAQVVSGRSASNSVFKSDRGDIRGTILRTGAVGRQEPLLRELLGTESSAFMARILSETRADYASHFCALLDEIATPSVVFWFAERSPDYVATFDSMPGLLGGFPHMIDRATLERVRERASAYVECLARGGLPQRLWRSEVDVEGTRRHADGYLYNHYYPSPEMHEAAADTLVDVFGRLLR